jgi:hypothetical protein
VLKRAPDNLAAIRGLAELHDRAEHDELSAMHRDGSKWMTEAAASGSVPEPPHVVPTPAVESRAVAPVVAAQPKPAPAVTYASTPTPAVEPVVDDELEAGIAALGVFAAGKTDKTETIPAVSSAAPAPAPAPPSFVAPTMAEPPKPKPAVSAFAAPTTAEKPTVDETSPWQPVEIESAAAHLLEATASSAWSAPAVPAKPVTPAVPAAWQSEADVAEAPMSFETPTADLGSTDLVDAGFPEFAEFSDLGDVSEAVAPPQAAFAASQLAPDPVTPVAAHRAADAVPVIDLAAMAPVAADTPTLIQPRVSSLEELDPELPALVNDAWSEQQDVYVLPAAVEAERAIADEGPGVWPPVIPDDPIEAPIAAREVAPAVPEPAPARRPNLGALNKFLRRVETRRSAVVAEYLAG